MGKYLKWLLIAVGAYLVYKNWEMIKTLLPMKKSESIDSPIIEETPVMEVEKIETL